MAEIVKACDSSLPGRPVVAVKRILPHLCEDLQYRAMFLDESRVLARLDHPNIIRAFEIGEVEGTPYIAMDFVDGQDARMLFQRARSTDGQIPIAAACYIIACVCDGLHDAHEQRDEEGELLGLVHRDVSLQNVLLSYAGDVKITDFGIAVSSQNEAHTEVGIVKGKFGYMSPEQIRGAPLDRRSDVFGAGICLYELLTCERLFVGDTDYKAIEKVRNVAIDPPSKLNRNIPSDLERIVMKALAKHPRDRHQSASDLRRELLAFMAASGETCTPDDMGAYLRDVFAHEYESPDEAATTIGDEDPGLAAARAELAAREAARDGTTGLAAFDDLEPISVAGFAGDPVTGAAVRLPAAALAAPSRDSRPSGGVVTSSTQSSGNAIAGAPTSFRPAPVVPPLVPTPESIPGAVKSPDRQRDNDNGVPEPRPLVMDWDEHEPTTISRGLPPIPLASDQFDADEEVTRVRSDDALPPLGASHGAGEQFASPAVITAAESFENTSRPPAVSPFPAAADGSSERRIPVRIVGGVVAALVVSAAVLYWMLERSPATIRLTTEPRDARVHVDGAVAPGSASPFVLSDLDPGKEHDVVVDKPGYQSWSTRLKLRADQVLDLPLIKLERVAPPTAAPEPMPPPAAEPASTPPPPERPKFGSSADREARAAAREARAAARAARLAEKQAAKPTAAVRAERAPAAPAAASGGATGTLRINTRPWSRVTIDGRLIGNTPQMAILLRPGPHKVNLVNPEFKIDKTLTVEIKAGEVVTRIVNLQ